MQQALDFRTQLLNAEAVRFRADVTADYEDHVYTFSLDCSYSDGAAAVTVSEPQTLAGITAEVSEDGTKIQFGDTAVDFGTLAGGRLAPMAAGYLLGKSWTGEYISAAGEENGRLRMTVLSGYGDDELTVDTWFSPDTGVPEYCEISYEGRKVLSAVLSDFSWS